MYSRLLTICLTTMLIASCGTTGPVRVEVADTSCDWVIRAEPIVEGLVEISLNQPVEDKVPSMLTPIAAPPVATRTSQ